MQLHDDTFEDGSEKSPLFFKWLIGLIGAAFFFSGLTMFLTQSKKPETPAVQEISQSQKAINALQDHQYAAAEEILLQVLNKSDPKSQERLKVLRNLSYLYSRNDAGDFIKDLQQKQTETKNQLLYLEGELDNTVKEKENSLLKIMADAEARGDTKAQDYVSAQFNLIQHYIDHRHFDEGNKLLDKIFQFPPSDQDLLAIVNAWIAALTNNGRLADVDKWQLKSTEIADRISKLKLAEEQKARVDNSTEVRAPENSTPDPDPVSQQSKQESESQVIMFKLSRLSGHILFPPEKYTSFTGSLHFIDDENVDIITGYSLYNGIEMGTLSGKYRIQNTVIGPEIRIEYLFNGANRVGKYSCRLEESGSVTLCCFEDPLPHVLELK